MALMPSAFGTVGLINSSASHIYVPSGNTVVINEMSLTGGHTYLIVASYRYVNKLLPDALVTILSTLYDGSSVIEESYRYNHGDTLVAFYTAASNKTVALRSFQNSGVQQEVAQVSLKAYQLD